MAALLRRGGRACVCLVSAGRTEVEIARVGTGCLVEWGRAGHTVGRTMLGRVVRREMIG